MPSVVKAIGSGNALAEPSAPQRIADRGPQNWQALCADALEKRCFADAARHWSVRRTLRVLLPRPLEKIHEKLADDDAFF